MSAFSNPELQALVALKTPSQVLTVRVGHSRYGIDVNCLREIRPWERASADGSIAVRGERVIVYDLRQILDMPTRHDADTVTALVLHEGTTFGLTVDRVEDVLELLPGALRKALSLGSLLRNALAVGIAQLDDGDLPVLLLDVGAVRRGAKA